MKCAHEYCARDAVSAFLGRRTIGRPSSDVSRGPAYCEAHYGQLRRGAETTRPVQRYGRHVRAEAVEDCAVIAEFHGHTELAALLRRLKS